MKNDTQKLYKSYEKKLRRELNLYPSSKALAPNNCQQNEWQQACQTSQLKTM